MGTCRWHPSFSCTCRFIIYLRKYKSIIISYIKILVWQCSIKIHSTEEKNVLKNCFAKLTRYPLAEETLSHVNSTRVDDLDRTFTLPTAFAIAVKKKEVKNTMHHYNKQKSLCLRVRY